MRGLHITRTILTGLGLASLTAGGAIAHPHVLVYVKAVILVDSSAKMTGIRQVWSFDEAYSAFAVTGFKKDANGKILKSELVDLAKMNVESLKEYNYFTSMKQGRTELGFGDPLEGYQLDYDGKSLILSFVLPLKAATPLAKANTLKIDDDSFFVSFTYDDKDPVSIEGNAPGCAIDLKKPEKLIDAGSVSKMSEDIFNSMKSGFGASYASSVRINCQ